VGSPRASVGTSSSLGCAALRRRAPTRCPGDRVASATLRPPLRSVAFGTTIERAERNTGRSCDATGNRFATGGRLRPDARAGDRPGRTLTHLGDGQTTSANRRTGEQAATTFGSARVPPSLRVRDGISTQSSDSTEHANREKTGHESPRNRHDGHATGRGVLAIPLGMALLREAAPVGSAEAS